MSELINTRNCFSEAVPFFGGVLQVSVLWPLLFTLYTTLLSSFIHIHKLGHYLYADDTQTPKYTYPYLKQTHTFLLHSSVSVSVISLVAWQTIDLDSMQIKQILLYKVHPDNVTNILVTPIFNQNIIPSHIIYNLGVKCDSNFNFRKHISPAVAKTISIVLTTSKLEYCNSLLYNITSKDIGKLQCV